MKLTKLILAAACILGPITADAQTKRVAHFGHSGSKATFTADAFDLDGSNFGEAPTSIVRNAKLDSLIFLDARRVVMVTTEVCHDEYRHNPEETIWRAGRDTVYDHPHFKLQHNLDSIKQVLKEQYNFKNPVRSIVFIGYDNKKNKHKDDRYQAPTQHPNQQQQNQNSGGNQEAALPAVGLPRDGGGTSGGLLMWALCFAAVLSAGVAFFAKAKPKQA